MDESWRSATGFEHISAAVSRIKARVDAAIVARDEDAAAEAHADMIDAGHRMRMVQRAEVRRDRG